MNRSTRNRMIAVAGAAMLAATLVGGGAGAAFATERLAQPVASVAAAATSISATPSVKSVAAWQQFTVTGRTSGLAAGTTLTLQQMQGSHWVSLPARTVVNRDHSYSLRVKLGLHGVNQLRIVSGSHASPVFKVTVR